MLESIGCESEFIVGSFENRICIHVCSCQMLESIGCGSEFIVGSFENRICMCAHVKCWSRLVVGLSSL